MDSTVFNNACRQEETEVTKLSQNNVSIFAVCITWASKLSGGGEEAKDGTAPYVSLQFYLLETEISSADEAWLVERKKQTLYWVLNELLTNIHLRIT